jgi:hypothetical protein
MNRDFTNIKHNLNNWNDYDSCPNLANVSGDEQQNTPLAGGGYVRVDEVMSSVTKQNGGYLNRDSTPKFTDSSRKSAAVVYSNKRNSVRFYQDEIELMDVRGNDENGDQIVLGSREIPIDCPPLTTNRLIMPRLMNSSGSILAQPTRNNLTDEELKRLNNAIIERIKSDISRRQVEMTKNGTVMLRNNYPVSANASSKNSNQIYSMNSQKGLSQQSVKIMNRKSLIRNSSLSTISEEKTITTLDETTTPNNSLLSNSESAKVPQPASWIAVLTEFENVISDENKAVLLEEFVKVFEASSKGGTFNRNVPIRISSPFKEANRKQRQPCNDNNSSTSPDQSLSPMRLDLGGGAIENSIDCGDDSDLSTTVKSSCSNNDDSNALFTVTNASFFGSNINKLVAKKMRFVKRLKNRIETRRGRPLIVPPRSSSHGSFGSENRAMSRSASTQMSHENSVNRKELEWEFSDKNNNSLIRNDNFEAAAATLADQYVVLAKSDIKPVFF